MHHLVQNYIIIRGEREVYEEMVPNLTCSPLSNTSFVVAPLICYRIQKGSGSGVLLNSLVLYMLRTETWVYPQKIKSAGHFLPYLYYLFSPRPCARLQAQSYVTILDLSSRPMDSLQLYQNPLLTDSDTQKSAVGSFP